MSGKPLVVIRTYEERELIRAQEQQQQLKQLSQPPPPPPPQFSNEKLPVVKELNGITTNNKNTNNAGVISTAKIAASTDAPEHPRQLQPATLRNRQHHTAPPPPPPPPPPLIPAKDESDSCRSTPTVKVSNTIMGKKPIQGSVVAILPPPSPPACPTPDYDTMSIASEQEIKRNNVAIRPLLTNRNVNGMVGKSKSSVIINGKCPNADCVEMESLESFKLTNPSTIRPKPPATYFRKSPSRSSESSINSRASMPNGTSIEGAKPTITIREYPTTLDRKNPSRFQFLNQNTAAPVVQRDQPITSQLQSELTQTLSRVKLQGSSNGQEPQVATTNGAGRTNVVTICVNTKQKPQAPQAPTSSAEPKNTGGPFYLFPRKKPTDDTSNHQKMVSTTLISKADLQDVELKKSPRYPEAACKNSVTFNFGHNERTESRSAQTAVAHPNGILKNGSNGNVSQVQIQNLNSAPNHRLPQQKTIKFGGITTIIRNSPEPKM